MKLGTIALLLYASGVQAEIRDVLKLGEIDRLFAHAAQSVQVHGAPAYDIWFEVLTSPSGYRANSQADDMVFVRGGRATVVLGGELQRANKDSAGALRGTGIIGGRRYEVSAGDVIHIPRGTPYHIDPGAIRFERVVIRVRPSGDNLPLHTGFLSPRQMPDVLKNAEIDSTFTRYDSNQPIHSGRNYTMNYVIYAGRSGPWEAHRDCVDIYFVRVGTAVAQLGGKIENANEESPGEIRGTGVQGARSYEIAPSDLVLIPRNTAHHMTPSGPKLGYLLMKIWVE